MRLNVPTMSEMMAKGETPEILFWVGCAGSFDDRAKKITKALVKILNHCKVSFAVLGTEESCSLIIAFSISATFCCDSVRCKPKT